MWLLVAQGGGGGRETTCPGSLRQTFRPVADACVSSVRKLFLTSVVTEEPTELARALTILLQAQTCRRLLCQIHVETRHKDVPS